MTPPPLSGYSTPTGLPLRREHGDGTVRGPRRTSPPPPFPPGSREAQVWSALAYRGQVPTVDAVNRELHRGVPAPDARPKKPLRRAAVAARLANQGPVVASYVASYWAAHRTAPGWDDIARALRWPGDAIDHERALRALVDVEWIRGGGNGTDPTYPGPRWIRRDVPAPRPRP